MKIYAEVLAYCDFTFNGTNDRNSNKLALHDSCLSINLIFTEEYPSVDRSARIFDSDIKRDTIHKLRALLKRSRRLQHREIYSDYDFKRFSLHRACISFILSFFVKVKGETFAPFRASCFASESHFS